MPFECWFLRWMRHYTKSRFGDWFMPRATRLGDYGAVWIALALGMLFFRRTRRAAVQLLVTLAAESLLCNTFLKPFIGRPRPFELSSKVRPLIAPPQDRSFPSGHTASSVAAAASLYLSRCPSGLPMLQTGPCARWWPWGWPWHWPPVRCCCTAAAAAKRRRASACLPGRPVPWRVRLLDNPPRLVMDFREVDWLGIDKLRREGVADLRAGVFRPGWSRLVIELRGPMVVERAGMETEGGTRIAVTLRPATSQEFAAIASHGSKPAGGSRNSPCGQRP